MTTINARLIAVTKPVVDFIPSSEDLISYCARVSNSSNQENYDTSSKLLKYCVDNKHWSIFTMGNAIIEIEAPRDITRQFTRHESLIVIDHGGGEFSTVNDGFNMKAGGVQEFSQRYSSDIEFTDREFRSQDTKNRQNSVDNLSDEDTKFYSDIVTAQIGVSEFIYSNMLQDGVAKECARVFLPEGLTMSRLYVNGTIRSWIHYLQVREGNGTQKEHVDLAKKIRACLEPEFPNIFKMLDYDASKVQDNPKTETYTGYEYYGAPV